MPDHPDARAALQRVIRGGRQAPPGRGVRAAPRPFYLLQRMLILCGWRTHEAEGNFMVGSKVRLMHSYSCGGRSYYRDRARATPWSGSSRDRKLPLSPFQVLNWSVELIHVHVI